MNQQRGFVNIVLIVLVVILAGAVGYFALIKKSPEITQQTNTPAPTQNEADFNQNTAQKISYSGQWKRAQFPQNDYNHSINIMLPSPWEFNCCGDTDSWSAHVNFPPSTKIDDLSRSPHITVYDFVKAVCPNGGLYSCSIDELQGATPSQFMVNLTDHLDKNGEVAGLESLKRTRTVKLSNFSMNAVIYSGVSRSNQPIDLYLIQSSKGVVGVAFQQPQSFESSFKTEFLNRITTN